MTLADIQRLQEEKDREERARQQQQVQAVYDHQIKMQKGQMSWPSTVNQASSHVKTLAEIQKEESDRLSKSKREHESRERENTALSNVGIWSNASSQLSWKSKSPNTAWSSQPDENEFSSQKSGFWTDDDPSLAQRNKTSAFDSSGGKGFSPAPSQSAKSGLSKVRKDHVSIIYFLAILCKSTPCWNRKRMTNSRIGAKKP